MAILAEVPGLEVCIACKHESMREYRDRSMDTTSTTAVHYVEALSNAPFEVHTRFTPPFPSDRAVEIGISVDGKLLDELVIRPRELFERKAHISPGPISDDADEWSLQKYRFAPLHIIEADTGTTSAELTKELEPVGTIAVTLYFLKNVRLTRIAQSPRKIIKTFDALTEKDVKGASLSHQAILGEPKAVQQVDYLTAEHDDNGVPFAVFKFCYRSLEALKDLHIVERTPDPVELLNSDDGALAQMNREQLEMIVRRMRDREEVRVRTKRVRSEDTVRGDGGEADGDGDGEVVETRSVDLRANRRMVRGRAVVGEGCEVIVLD